MESLPVEMRRKILEHFSNAELITISLVNKLFNYEARSLMSNRGTLNADLGVQCQNILSFASHLKGMKFIPFSGIKINWSLEEHHQLCSPQPLLNPTPTLDSLDRVLWKSLSVNMHVGRLDPKNCTAFFQLVQKLLKDFCQVLEQLELNNHPKLLRFIEEIIQGSRFPQLKILKLVGPAQYDPEGTKKNFMKDMVHRAPNLEEFHQDECPDLSENLLDGSSAVLLSNCDTFNPALYEFSKDYNGIVKLKKMDMYYMDFICMRRFNRTVPRILQSSFDTLHSIKINLAFLLPVMRSGVRLERLTDFTTTMDYAGWELMDPRILLLLKQFDFTQVFPKLNTVKMRPDGSVISVDHMIELVEQGMAAARMHKSAADRAVNIKHLSFFVSLTPKAVPFLAGMFPNVEIIETKQIEHDGQQTPYGLIWKHWPELKKLQVETVSFLSHRDISRSNENLDSVFCGIFPAEVARLREQDEEYLRTVHIVPVMPSITCLRGLRTLGIARSLYYVPGIRSEDIAPMFTKVTALVAFERCPDLCVNIEAKS